VSSRSIYRKTVESGNLVPFTVVSGQTNLLILATRDLRRDALTSISHHRRVIESYLKLQPRFGTSLQPVEVPVDAPDIVRVMAQAGRAAGIGPMSAVAGAVAEAVGRDLHERCEEVIVENGGDVFMHTLSSRTVAIYAGASPLSGRLGIAIESGQPAGVCTSTGTFGHSLSFGRADACTVVAKSAALADSVATASCNRIRTADDLGPAVDAATSIAGVLGAVAVLADRMAVRGAIRLVTL